MDPHLSRSLVVCDLQVTCDAFWSAQKQHLDRSHFRLKEPRAEKTTSAFFNEVNVGVSFNGSGGGGVTGDKHSTA